MCVANSVQKKAVLFTLLLLGGVWGLQYFDSLSHVQAAKPKFESREAEIADAIKKNRPIFVDWPKPELAFVFTGEMDGYLEPCGCAGLDNQKGGLKRRLTFLRKLADDGWPVVTLDMGGHIRRFGPQAEIKFRFAINAMTQLGYHAVGLGIKELQLDANQLVYVLSNFEDAPNPMVSANVSIIDAGIGLSSQYKVFEVGGRKIGVTSVLGKKFQADLQNSPDIIWTDPAEALQVVVPKLQEAGCEWLILLSYSDPEESIALGKQFPEFQFVVTAGGAETPPNRLMPINDNPTVESLQHLVEVGKKGQYATVIGIYDDPKMPLRLQRVPLDHRFEDASEMNDLLTEYQKELETLGLSGLGLSSTKHPTDSFVGSAACVDCHDEETEIFMRTTHSHATKTLVELEPARHFDPECLSCHVTGWNPQEFFPYASGYQGLKETPLLLANGCENCHGPGAAHVAAENGDVDVDDKEIERLRARMRLKIVENEGNKDGQEIKTAVVVKKCQECHDLDNSPEFDFQKYWEKIKH